MFNKYFTVPIALAICAYFLLPQSPTYYELKNILNKALNFGRKILSKIYSVEKSGNVKSKSSKIFTVEELSKYNGENNGKIYLSILGNVFDVTEGRKYYEPGEHYSIFAGRDATKAFVTGDFSDSGLTDDISDINEQDLASLHDDWLKMYKDSYTYKGKLQGRFYDSNGKPTIFMKGIKKKVANYHLHQMSEVEYKMRFPPCNYEWSQEKGGRVWCSKLSGGVKRSWIGVPRKYYQPGSTSYRCACINLVETRPNGKVLSYEDCNPESSSCVVK